MATNKQNLIEEILFWHKDALYTEEYLNELSEERLEKINNKD